MNNKDFKFLFNQDFDIDEPTIGHFERFENRLKKPTAKYNLKTRKQLIAVASIALIFGFLAGQLQNKKGLELADISPKMEETQSYFLSVIKTEVEKINSQKSSENKRLIDDTFIRLRNLEKQYTKLTIELKESDQDKRVVFAMISNFQQRIEILQNLIKHIKNAKKIKQNETYS